MPLVGVAEFLGGGVLGTSHDSFELLPSCEVCNGSVVLARILGGSEEDLPIILDESHCILFRMEATPFLYRAIMIVYLTRRT